MSKAGRPLVEVELSTAGQSRQFCTGLSMLHRAGAIRFVQRVVPGHGDLVVVRAAGRTLLVDLFDRDGIDEVMLEAADAYAKRSFRVDGYADERIVPYGLCYTVYP